MRRRILEITALWCTFAVGLIAVPVAASPVPACNRASAPAVCSGPASETYRSCLALRGGGDQIVRLTAGGEVVGMLSTPADRLNVGTAIACRLLAVGAPEPARRVLNIALNAVVRIMDSEGRSKGVAEPLVNLAQVQIAAGFDTDADRTLAAFDWAVRDMSMTRDAVCMLALAGLRLAEVGRRNQAAAIFAEARALAGRVPPEGVALLQHIAALEADAGL